MSFSRALLTDIKLVLALGAFILTSCSTIGGKEESKLVGRWRSTDRQHTAEYIFFENGIFNGSVTGEGALVSKFTGKWLLRDGAILYEYTADRMGRIAVGTKDRDKLLRIDRDQYVIEAADGTVRKYMRVKRD